MARSIPTVEGPREPSPEDREFMDYLDDLAEIPGGHSFGLLLFKGDPVAFRMGRAEWEAEQQPSAA